MWGPGARGLRHLLGPGKVLSVSGSDFLPHLRFPKVLDSAVQFILIQTVPTRPFVWVESVMHSFNKHVCWAGGVGRWLWRRPRGPLCGETEKWAHSLGHPRLLEGPPPKDLEKPKAPEGPGGSGPCSWSLGEGQFRNMTANSLTFSPTRRGDLGPLPGSRWAGTTPNTQR